MDRTIIASVVAASAFVASAASADVVDVIGGQTNVLLDFDTLAAAANLEFSSVSDDVIAPGDLGEGSVAFGINSRDANMLPTTFSYDTDDFLGSFSGSIEHMGSVFFNDDAVEVGNFTIGFDAARAVGDNSGFFVASTTGIAAILFDISAPSQLDAGDTELIIGADLFVSNEFATFLVDQGLASSDLTGADVGDALVAAVVPAPGALLGLAGLAFARRRRG